MIPEQAIVAWRREAPWASNAMVEQDLVISRALVALYTSPEIADRLAFRGGTALYKLHLRPAARYSEDIDLVQVRAEPIGETLDLIRHVLDSWLGPPQRKLKDGRVNLIYRFDSEDTPPIRMRLKVEINSREHFTELGLAQVPFAIDNPWFGGSAMVTTFGIDELLGTKLRALYQRKKGRDLFDLWLALASGKVDAATLVRCFQRYMAEGGHAVSRAEFEANLAEKAGRKDFRGDMDALLRPGLTWDFDAALRLVLDQVVCRLPGDAWRAPVG
jgi:predicted nucleotidyltransferase component of viral defense system